MVILEKVGLLFREFFRTVNAIKITYFSEVSTRFDVLATNTSLLDPVVIVSFTGLVAHGCRSNQGSVRPWLYKID